MLHPATQAALDIGYILGYALIAWGLAGVPKDIRMVLDKYGRKD
jgi:hypothetical protein